MQGRLFARKSWEQKLEGDIWELERIARGGKPKKNRFFKKILNKWNKKHIPEEGFYISIINKWSRIIHNHTGDDLDESTKEVMLGSLNQIRFQEQISPIQSAQRLIDFFNRFLEINRRLTRIERAVNTFRFRLKGPARKLVARYLDGTVYMPRKELENELRQYGLSEDEAFKVSIAAAHEGLDQAMRTYRATSDNIKRLAQKIMDMPHSDGSS